MYLIKPFAAAKKRTYFSISIEMPQKFKENNSIGEKMKNFKEIKNDILKI